MPTELNKQPPPHTHTHTHTSTQLYFLMFSSSYPLYPAPVLLPCRKRCSFVIWMLREVLGVITRKYLCHEVPTGKIPGNKKSGEQTENILPRALWTVFCLGSTGDHLFSGLLVMVYLLLLLYSINRTLSFSWWWLFSSYFIHFIIILCSPWCNGTLL